MSFLLWMLERSDWLTFAASTEANENREDVGDDDAATAVCPRDRDRLWCLASRGLSCKQKDSKVQRKFLFFLMVKGLKHPISFTGTFRLFYWAWFSTMDILIAFTATRLLYNTAWEWIKQGIHNLIGSTAILRCAIAFWIRSFSAFSWANQPLVKILAPTDSHHLLLQSEVCLRQNRLQFLLATAAVVIGETLISYLTIHWDKAVSRVRIVSILCQVAGILWLVRVRGRILICLIKLQWRLSDAAIDRITWDIVLRGLLSCCDSSSYVIGLSLLDLLFDFFLLRETQGSSPPLEGKLESGLLDCVLIGIILLFRVLQYCTTMLLLCLDTFELVCLSR